jgi:hypothetical protein
MSARWDWNVAIFCRNEQSSIGRCIESVTLAGRSKRTLITLIINGCTDESGTAALAAARRCGASIAIYAIPFGDKSNAMNCFYYDLRESAAHYFFVDAYATIGLTALEALETCLATRPDVIAATGIAANGRTMSRRSGPTLTHGGQLHGQLHALRKDFIDRLVAKRVRLPIGLYRGDGLMGSMVMHDLDPLHVPWESKRIGGSPNAVYTIPVLSAFRPHDVQRQFRRKIRQLRGDLENLAIRAIVYEQGYEGLPEYADEMVQGYIAGNVPPRVSLVDRPFQALALRQIRAFRRPAPVTLQPIPLSRWEGGAI